MSPCHEAARRYALRGWSVFPCHTPQPDGRCSCRRPCGRDIGKHPRTMHGLSDATTELDRIDEWWGMWPTANVAIRTGRDSGIIIIDADTLAGLHALESHYGTLPQTVTANTGRGGEHRIFASPEGSVRTIAKIGGVAVDSRGDGGYFIAPPSLHASGSLYAWAPRLAPGQCPIAALPPRWADLLAAAPQVAPTFADDETFPEGQRNSSLASMGGTMRRRGFSYEAIVAALEIENRRRCRPPLPLTEVQRIAASVARYQPAWSGTGRRVVTLRTPEVTHAW